MLSWNQSPASTKASKCTLQHVFKIPNMLRRSMLPASMAMVGTVLLLLLPMLPDAMPRTARKKKVSKIAARRSVSHTFPHESPLRGAESTDVGGQPRTCDSSSLPSEHCANLACQPVPCARLGATGLLVIGKTAHCPGRESPLPLAEVGDQNGQDRTAETAICAGEDGGEQVHAVNVVGSRSTRRGKMEQIPALSTAQSLWSLSRRQ
mmetsp:Transcript_70267/g.195568  ORF Transcript_70267/g.195568 Transcript_70267/m.195568 type:complete len:207 (+) Transcript_70267:171-791(+)